jgi:hypothetical protein
MSKEAGNPVFSVDSGICHGQTVRYVYQMVTGARSTIVKKDGGQYSPLFADPPPACVSPPLHSRCRKFSRGVAAGSGFAPGGDDKLVKLWRVGRGNGALNSMGGNASSVVGLCFSPNSEQLLSASEGGSLKIFDLAEGRVSRSLNGHLAKVRAGGVGGGGGMRGN